jgi:hypothetical protein
LLVCYHQSAAWGQRKRRAPGRGEFALAKFY